MNRQLIIGIALILLTACTGGKSCAGSRGGTTDAFVWWNWAEPATIDPGLVKDFMSANIVYQLFEGLTEYDPKTLEPVPGVATSWDVSPDGLVYTFHLRTDAKWSDGSPVTAADFEYSWKRALDPTTASEYAYILYAIRNAEEYNTGKLPSAETVGVKTIDNHTLRVELKNPTPYFPQLIAFATFRPVHRATVEKWGTEWTRPEHMVSNGPYRLTSWVPQKEVAVEKDLNYWDRANVKIAKAIFLPTEDRETALKMYIDGKVHFDNDLPLLKIPELSKRSDYVNIPEWATYFVLFNTQRKPFDDVRVRRAFSYAIDRQKLVELRKMNDTPTTHSTPPGHVGYTPPEGEGYDPIKAKALLTEAGYANPKTFPSLTYHYNTNENHKLIGELVQRMWRENLGIDVTLANQEWKSLIETWSAGNFELARYAWVGDFLDPVNFIDLFTTTSSQNYTRWSNAEYDQLVKQSAETGNPQERMALLQKAEAILLQELPVIPLFHQSRPQLLDPRVKGFYPNPMSQHPLKFAYFEEGK